MIEVAFLGSGSTGNCAVIRAGRTAVLLDAGLSPRQIGVRLGKLGMSLDDVSALLLTHEHSDHVSSAAVLATKRGLPVYATRGTLAKAGLPGPLFADLRTVADGEEVCFGGGDLTVRVTRTPHDGVDPVCYVFADGAGRRVGVVTDLGHLSKKVLEALEGCEVLGLEANHDVDVLREGAYPAFLKKRILSDVGHLSNDAAAAGLVAPPRRADENRRGAPPVEEQQHADPGRARAPPGRRTARGEGRPRDGGSRRPDRLVPGAARGRNRMKVQVTVVPKSGVLDPQGKAIAGALTRLGFPGVGDVRAGKVFRVEVEAKDAAEAKALAGQMAEKLLCNPVIEEYEAEVLG